MRDLFLISLKAKCREGSEKCWLVTDCDGAGQAARAGNSTEVSSAQEIHCAARVHFALGLGELIAFLIGLQLEIPI